MNTLRALRSRIPGGPYGASARYLATLVPDGEGAVRGDAFAIGGMALGHPEVSFTWLFGPAGADMQALVAEVVPRMRRPLLAFPMSLADDVRAAGFTVGTDLLCMHDGPLPDGDDTVVPLDVEADRPRVAEAIRDRLPPPAVLARIPFRFLGLDRGEIPAILETTVDDGEYAVIQQVFTDPAHQRTGLGKALLSAAVRKLRRDGRSPLYVVSADNAASVALSRAVGFRVVAELGVVTPP